MSVSIRNGWCTDSHSDWFTRNLIACKGDGSGAYQNGCLSRPVRIGSISQDEPLTREDAIRHIRYDLNSAAEDENIYAWLASAFRKIESDTGVISLTSQWRIAIECFPTGRSPLVIPIWPIQSVDLIAYYDADGVLTSISAGSPGTTLILDNANRPSRLALETPSDAWPTDLRAFQPGILEVTAGFETAALYPDELKQSAKILIAQSALFREHAVSGPGIAVSSVLMDYDRWIERWVLPGC